MSNTTDSSKSATTEAEVTPDETTRVNEVMRGIDAWKTRIDELKQLDLARNVNHVAASQLRVAYEDAAGSADTLRQGVQEFLHDVDEAFDAVQAVIARG